MLLYHDYLWLRTSTTARFKALAFLKFLQYEWNIKYLPLVPVVLLGKALRRVFRNFTS
jgi:hypothetical protein